MWRGRGATGRRGMKGCTLGAGRDRSRRASRRHWAAGAFSQLSLVVCVLAILALAGSWWPLFDFYAQLQMQILVVTTAIMLVAVSVQMWRSFVQSLVCAAALGWSLYPHLAPPPRVEPGVAPGTGAPVRIAWANLRNWVTGGPAVVRLLETETPDIVILTELTERHRAAALTAPGYGFRTPFPAGSAFDLLLMSRVQPTEVRFDYAFGADYPILEARFCAIDGASVCLAIIALHAPRPPLPEAAWGEPANLRDGLLALAATMARRRLVAQDHVLLIGDFNATPYSSVVRDMLARSGLIDTTSAAAENPEQPRPTWLSTWPGVGLPIDNALVSPGLRVVERRLGPNIQSDHRPLVLHLRLLGP